MCFVLNLREGQKVRSNELDDFRRRVVGRVDREHWAIDHRFQRDAFPGWIFGVGDGVQ